MTFVFYPAASGFLGERGHFVSGWFAPKGQGCFRLHYCIMTNSTSGGDIYPDRRYLLITSSISRKYVYEVKVWYVEELYKLLRPDV